MSIQTQIEALQTDKTNIRNAILNKGGTCASGNGFDDFANDIGTISGGGGGTIAVIEGDVTWSTSASYIDIPHSLEVSPISAEILRTDSTNVNAVKYAYVNRYTTIMGTTSLGCIFKYYNSTAGSISDAYPTAPSGYLSKLESDKVRIGQGNSSRSFMGTYHYKIYYEA